MKVLLTSALATIIILTMAEKNDTGSFHYDTQSKKPIFSFGVIADVQYADYDPAGTRYYQSSTGKLREALTSLKRDSAEFIINLGDLIDKDFNSYKPVMDIIDSSGLKTYHIAGNHDYSVEPRLKKKIPLILSLKEDYYYIIYKSYRLIFLNGNEISTYISDKKSSVKQASEYLGSMKNRGEINAVDWNGGFSSKQLAWLQDQLNEASMKNEKVLLMCHFPIYPENVHNLLNSKEVLSLIGNYNNIIAWFNGHNHTGNYGNFNRIHFVTFKGMVETDSKNSFSLVSVYDNRIWIRGYGREKSQILAY